MKRGVFALAILVLALFGTQAMALSFAPGKWQHQTHLLKAEIPGVPGWVVRLIAGNSKRQSCHGSDELQRRPEALLTADERAVCRVRHFSMADGKLVFETFCTNDRFPDGLMVSSRGTYTQTSYAIQTISTGTKDGKPVRIETTGTGRLVGSACQKS